MFGRRVGTLGKVSKPDVLGLELLKLLHRHALVAATRLRSRCVQQALADEVICDLLLHRHSLCDFHDREGP